MRDRATFARWLGLPAGGSLAILTIVSKLDLTDDEHATVAALLRGTIDEDKFPLSPRLAPPLRSALAKLDPRTGEAARDLTVFYALAAPDFPRSTMRLP